MTSTHNSLTYQRFLIKGIQSNAETKIVKEKYFLHFALLPLTLHDQQNLGASPNANGEVFNIKTSSSQKSVLN